MPMFGFLLFGISPGIAVVAYGNMQDNTVPAVLIELVGATVSSLGAGLFFYAILSGRQSGREPMEPEEPAAAQAQG